MKASWSKHRERERERERGGQISMAMHSNSECTEVNISIAGVALEDKVNK